MRWLLLCSLLLLSGCNTEKIAQLEKENKELQARLAAQEGRNLLDLQEKCSKQARSEFNAEGWNRLDPRNLPIMHPLRTTIVLNTINVL